MHFKMALLNAEKHNPVKTKSMNKSTRKQFIQSSGILLATAIAGSSFNMKRKAPLLSFSTLGCPDWDLDQVLSFAAQHGYKGIEFRGLKRQLDILKCPEFSGASNTAATLQKMKSGGLQVVNLGSSATLHFAEGAERQKNLDDGKKYIDLAQQLQCPFIRVFPNNFPKDQDKKATIELIIKGLLELAEHAKGSAVSVLIESHGDLVKIDDLLTVMQTANHSKVGMIWDVTNMWTVTGESPVLAYQQLKKYIRHTHVKDAKMVAGKLAYTLLGKGEVPIFEAVDELFKGGYEGYYSFEWEKLWHPEIAEPEIALADYPTTMQQHFSLQKTKR